MALQIVPDRKRQKWYIYAWKAGPRIHVHEGKKKPSLNDLPGKVIRTLAEALDTSNAEPAHLFMHVIREWQRSADWERLEPSTRKVWQGHLTLIEARWGEFPYTIWDDPRMAAKVVKWRDERKHIPRTADIGITVLRALLKWAKLAGFVALNVASDIPQIARSADREEIIWTAADMAAFASTALALDRPHMIDGLRLAALTGLRRADLVSLTFDHVGKFVVSKTALKRSRGKRRRAVIPMTDALAALLSEVKARKRAEGVNTVLVNSFGQPWSADGFGGSFNRIRDAAGIAHVEEDGSRRPKHLHDLRGTFCTMLLAECALTDAEAAPIMAWSENRISRIRRVYVDDARVVVAIGARIAAKQNANPSGDSVLSL